MISSRQLNSQRGDVLFVVIIVLGMIMLVSGVIYTVQIKQHRLSLAGVESLQALYLADTGLERAMSEIIQAEEGLPDTTSPGGIMSGTEESPLCDSGRCNPKYNDGSGGCKPYLPLSPSEGEFDFSSFSPPDPRAGLLPGKHRYEVWVPAGADCPDSLTTVNGDFDIIRVQAIGVVGDIRRSLEMRFDIPST